MKLLFERNKPYVMCPCGDKLAVELQLGIFHPTNGQFTVTARPDPKHICKLTTAGKHLEKVRSPRVVE